MSFSTTPELRETNNVTLDDAGRRLLFTEARTSRSFDSQPIPASVLAEMWELTRHAPTAWNSQPLHVVHVTSPEAKQRLLPLVDERNRVKVQQAPVTSILAADSGFHNDLPTLFPPAPELRDMLESQGRQVREHIARFNASIQIGYFILAARAVGLVTGPMVGFDAEGTTAEFLDRSRLTALLLVNLGLSGPDPVPARLPRRAITDVVSTL